MGLGISLQEAKSVGQRGCEALSFHFPFLPSCWMATAVPV